MNDYQKKFANIIYNYRNHITPSQEEINEIDTALGLLTPPTEQDVFKAWSWGTKLRFNHENKYFEHYVEDGIWERITYRHLREQPKVFTMIGRFYKKEIGEKDE